MNRNKCGRWEAGLVGFGLLMIMCAIGWLAMIVTQNIREGVAWERGYMANWTLENRSSSILAKSEYINIFVNSLESNKDQFAKSNAVIFPTPLNSFENNLKALKTLRDLLNEIKNMNPSSPEYQWAIQQITGQEQGQARQSLQEIEGCYVLQTYPRIWDWHGLLNGLGFIVLGVFGFIFCGIGGRY